MKNALLVTIIFTLVIPNLVGALTYYVDGTIGNDDWDGTSPTYLGGLTGPKKTIRAGVDLARNNDTVIVADGIYTGQDNVDVYLDRDSITLRSANGPENCIINCLGEHQIFEFGNPGATPTMDGFTIKNANRPPIICYGETHVTIKNCIISNNFIDMQEEGVIYCTDYSAPTISNCIINNNMGSPFIAGILCNQDSTPIITNCTISDNWFSSGMPGGGILCEDYSQPTVTNCTISNNLAFEGGGIYCGNWASLILQQCTISDNWASGGPGIGGGILCAQDSQVTATNCTIRSNSAFEDGGGIYCRDWGVSLTLQECVISNNWAGREGGGIFCEDANLLKLTNCTISGNQAEFGGGVRWHGPSLTSLTLEQCTISNNWAEQEGGGIFCEDANLLKLTNCTISGNQAGFGGGIFCQQMGSVNITNCTIADNLGEYRGGGIHCVPSSSDSTQVSNSIIWGNQPEQVDVPPLDIAVNFSDVQDGWAGDVWPGAGNIDSDPCFASATDYHLRSEAGRYDPNNESWVTDANTSPCIDAGDMASPIGFEPFPNGGVINMGAYGGAVEASKSYFGLPVCLTPVAGDINGDCKVDFRDFTFMGVHWLEDNNP